MSVLLHIQYATKLRTTDLDYKLKTTDLPTGGSSAGPSLTTAASPAEQQPADTVASPAQLSSCPGQHAWKAASKQFAEGFCPTCTPLPRTATTACLFSFFKKAERLGPLLRNLRTSVEKL
mmetsp:Transcript_53752/g.174779  ORF Transcript_53752/g.174779 Transcript_53752/m.174779 type:complete len:120 (+) Transcript_53752:63-422(+)